MFAIILNWITCKFLLILIFTSAETNTKACSKLVVVDSEMSRSVNVQVELCVHRLCYTNGIRNIRAISTWMVEHQSSVVRCTHRFLQLLDSCSNCSPSHFRNLSKCRRHTEFSEFEVRACIQFVGFIQFPLIRCLRHGCIFRVVNLYVKIKRKNDARKQSFLLDAAA